MSIRQAHRGTPHLRVVGTKKTVVERFLSKITVQSNGCWLWTGYRNQDGYGIFRVKGQSLKAHRWGYEHWRGPVSSGKELDHVVCDTPACANPWHVEPTTHQANVLRGDGPTAQNARKTHCPEEHEYAPDNVIITTTGGRRCRTCDRVRKR